MNAKKIKTVVFYSTPAYGHINPVLPVLAELSRSGSRIIFYSTTEFEIHAQSCGAEFRSYDLGEITFDTSVGSRLPELSELILKFTCRVIDGLIEEVNMLKPDLIIFDTLAFWGRAAAERCGIISMSVNTLITVPGMFSKTSMMYTRRFSISSIAQMNYLFSLDKYRRQLKKKFPGMDCGTIDILMNKAVLNVYTYPRILHPDEKKLGKEHFFLGPSSVIRSESAADSERITGDNLVYASLGTVFFRNEKFWHRLVDEFGSSKYTLVISSSFLFGRIDQLNLPDNIMVRNYVDQKYMLKNSILFITAGGMNSLCEAAAFKVPCLIVPQQGEQGINAAVFEKYGLGRKLDSGKSIMQQGEKLICEYSPDEKTTEQFRRVRLTELLDLLNRLI